MPTPVAPPVMHVFHCDHCQHLVFFESATCVQCGRLLAYLPDQRMVGSLDEGGDGAWKSPLEPEQRAYRLRPNYAEHNVCNWAIPAGSEQEYCDSCDLTRTIPDLSDMAAKQAWYRYEVAKRRVLYSLVQLGISPVSKSVDPERGLAFEILADPVDPEAPPILTGHADGLITLNLAEADDAERERRRLQMHEPYRTLVGHIRHELGHYYWDRLIAGSDRLDAYRALFGDDREDYAQALQRHYDAGPAPDWQERYVSAYASTHAWEDWAETWAHYLHITDAIETAADSGLSIRPRRRDQPSAKITGKAIARGPEGFDQLMNEWFPLTFVLNNLNRGLGLPDAYPFVLSKPAVEKLRFVHETVYHAG